jgi:cytochrome c-type biogenesis protein CcmH/NrfF
MADREGKSEEEIVRSFARRFEATAEAKPWETWTNLLSRLWIL